MRFAMARNTFTLGMPPAMVWAKKTLLPSAIMPSSSAITLATESLKLFSPRLAAFFDLFPIELVVLPTLERHVGKQIGWGGPACRSIQIESGHQGHVDNASAQIDRKS